MLHGACSRTLQARMFASSASWSIAVRRLLVRPASLTTVRGLAAGVNPKGLKILTVLYPDPVGESATTRWTTDASRVGAVARSSSEG